MHATSRPLHQPLGVVFVIAVAACFAAGAFFVSGVMDLVGTGSGAVAGTWGSMSFR